MKTRVLPLVIFCIMLFSCKKETQSQLEKHVASNYQVALVGKSGDTTFSTVVRARMETVGLLVAEDDRLRAELLAYSGSGTTGTYTIRVTNKQAGNILARWGWEGLRINTIYPTSDVVPGNQSVIFTLVGDAKTGAIKVKADCPAGRDCFNSSELILNITTAILPISFVDNRASYDEKTRKTTISFTIEDPQDVNWIVIRKQGTDFEWKTVALIGCDFVTKNYAIKL